MSSELVNNYKLYCVNLLVSGHDSSSLPNNAKLLFVNLVDISLLSKYK